MLLVMINSHIGSEISFFGLSHDVRVLDGLILMEL